SDDGGNAQVFDQMVHAAGEIGVLNRATKHRDEGPRAAAGSARQAAAGLPVHLVDGKLVVHDVRAHRRRDVIHGRIRADDDGRWLTQVLHPLPQSDDPGAARSDELDAFTVDTGRGSAVRICVDALRVRGAALGVAATAAVTTRARVGSHTERALTHGAFERWAQALTIGRVGALDAAHVVEERASRRSQEQAPREERESSAVLAHERAILPAIKQGHLASKDTMGADETNATLSSGWHERRSPISQAG